jgi:hypothetical protein
MKHTYLTPVTIELKLDNLQVLCMSTGFFTIDDSATEDFTIVEVEYEGF